MSTVWVPKNRITDAMIGSIIAYNIADNTDLECIAVIAVTPMAPIKDIDGIAHSLLNLQLFWEKTIVLSHENKFRSNRVSD